MLKSHQSYVFDHFESTHDTFYDINYRTVN